ncbi:uncharacterized protein RJT20DRAFT_36698 [Scheffersomyces xylosifermentans]|uniref:uncharacterized protein n=1 Tax=Scheffersomyces xylosifermentans TaxID=1304137 RepID=UPI00315D8F6F
MSDPLAHKYSHWKRLIHKFQARRDIPFRRRFFIGYDLHGNTYWEFTIDGNMHRLRRKMEPYQQQLFKADYFTTVPPQWLQWLRRTRNVPPTLQELISDQVRQSNMKILAQQADAKWYNEKLRLEQEQQLKLNTELDRAQREAEEFKKAHQPKDEPESTAENNEVDPWKQADETSGQEAFEGAVIKPREGSSFAEHAVRNSRVSPEENETVQEKANPWEQADSSKDSNPINSASIKPRK